MRNKKKINKKWNKEAMPRPTIILNDDVFPQLQLVTRNAASRHAQYKEALTE